VDLVLGPGSGPDQLSAALEATAHHPRLGIRHPDPLELARGEQPRQGAGVEAVGLCPRASDPGVGRRDDDHLCDVGLDDSLDLPGVAGDLERDPVGGIEALGKQLEPLGGGLDPPRGANLTSLGDRHLAEVDVDVQGDASHLLLLSLTAAESQRANDTDAFAL
jgi:hypothetical protein